jgi:aspartate aminotransferase
MLSQAIRRSSRGEGCKFLSSRWMSVSPWANYEMAPLDPIIGLNEQYQADDYPKKVIVGVGAYRDDMGKPYVLPCVREAERRIFEKELDMEYSGIAGDAKFVDLSLRFAYGDDSPLISENRVQGAQSLSGTGGLAVYGKMIQKHGIKEIYIPDPSWGNHTAIFRQAGLDVKKYRYYDSATSDLDFKGLIQDLKSMPERSVVLLHGTWTLSVSSHRQVDRCRLTRLVFYSLCTQSYWNGPYNGTMEGNQ